MTALLLLTVLGAWAANEVKIVTSGQGEATSAIADGLCTLTVTPASGEYVTVDYITAVKIVDGSSAQAPRRSPGIDNTAITVTPVDGEAEPSGTTQYTFGMPGDGFDVEVTVDFQSLTAIHPSVALEGWTYGEPANTPEVEGNTGGGDVVFTYARQQDEDFTATVPAAAGDYIVKATISPKGMYAGAEVTAEFTISKATPELTAASEMVRLRMGEDGSNAISVVSGGETVEGTFAFTWTSSDEQVVTAVNGTLHPVGNGEATVVVRGPVGDANFDEAEVSFRVTVYTVYGITVDGTAVTSENCIDVTGDGSVKYDHGNGELTLSNAKLTQGIQVEGLDLTLYLVGDNRIETAGSEAIATTTAGKTLTFVTNQNEPGRLTADTKGTFDEADGAFAGFATVVKNNQLAAVLEKTGVTSLFVPMTPVVTSTTEDAAEEDAGTVIDMGDEGNAVSQETLVNVTIDGILYTLDDQQTPGIKDDGFVDNYAAEDNTGTTVTANIVVLNSTMTDSEVQNLATQTESGSTKPGSDSYAESFKGVTFLLPKGEGKIYLKNVITDATHALQVKIGTDTPVSFTTNGKYEDKEVAYNVDADTYVYIYVIEISSTTAPQLAFATRRIGPKGHVSGGLGGLSISASKIEVPASKALDAATLAANTAGNTVVVKDLDVKTIADGAFSGVSAAMAYIDLSATSIVGVNVSRSSGAFAGVDENTFIYMPAGNTTSEPNVVIGNVCANMVLDGDGTHAFRTAKNFTATAARLNRSFVADKRSTVYLPYAVSQETADALGSFYTFDGISGTTVNMTKVASGGLKANTPYIFLPGSSVSQIAVSGAAVKTSALPSLNFVGTFERLTWPAEQANIYCFVGEERDGFEVGMFARMGAGSSVPPFRAYMRAAGIPAPVMDICWMDEEDGVTAINAVEDSPKGYAPADSLAEGRAAAYNMQGQCVAHPTKGLYIVKGKKVVLK